VTFAIFLADGRAPQGSKNNNLCCFEVPAIFGGFKSRARPSPLHLVSSNLPMTSCSTQMARRIFKEDEVSRYLEALETLEKASNGNFSVTYNKNAVSNPASTRSLFQQTSSIGNKFDFSTMACTSDAVNLLQLLPVFHSPPRKFCTASLPQQALSCLAGARIPRIKRLNCHRW
jgi:hypothetical protein